MFLASCGKAILARESFEGEYVWGKSGLSGYLVYLVSLVQPNKPDRPNRPNEQYRLADFFSIPPTNTATAASRGPRNAPNRDLAPYPYRGGYGGPRLPMRPKLAHA